MKKTILTLAVMAIAVPASFAFDISTLESVAANAKMAAETDSLNSASGIADMSFSGSIARNDNGVVVMPAVQGEMAKEQVIPAADKKTALTAKIPQIAPSHTPSEQKEPFWKQALRAAVIITIGLPVLLGAWGLSIIRDGINRVLDWVVGC
ncbi:MAG: hypothetical protein ABIG11_03340 [bacterium]